MKPTSRFLTTPVHKDARGTLIALEQGGPLPFEPKRAFIIKDVGAGQVRAKHAVSCDEFLILLSGHCRITLRHIGGEACYPLDDPSRGLFVPAGVWMMLDQFDREALLLVMASARYGETDYFEDPQI